MNEKDILNGITEIINRDVAYYRGKKECPFCHSFEDESAFEEYPLTDSVSVELCGKCKRLYMEIMITSFKAWALNLLQNRSLAFLAVAKDAFENGDYWDNMLDYCYDEFEKAIKKEVYKK